ncbi:unnamed protein product, partial [Rotaria magnacalcarata]
MNKKTSTSNYLSAGDKIKPTISFRKDETKSKSSTTSANNTK